MKPLKVSEVNNYIKRLLSEDLILSNIEIEGEVSNFKRHFSGHLYFSLKDDKGRIKCVMFKSDAENLKIEPREGQKIIAQGYISIYGRGGDYQLYIKGIVDMGVGKLYKDFEDLKNKLNKEGLFDESYKKPLPLMPKKIGIVTSSTGAAIEDIINVINRRFPICHLVLYPSLVQGENAPKDIIEGLKYLDNREDIDMIIFGRGGGSIEELSAFNNEELARIIFSLKTPNISAVGHETDFTIADFVSDLRAPTPSAAAEMAVPDISYLINRLEEKRNRMVNRFKYIFDFKHKELNHVFKTLKYKSPSYRVQEDNQKIDILIKDLSLFIKELLNKKNFKLNELEKNLHLQNPLLSLEKGHGIITNKEGNLLKSIKEIAVDDDIRILMKDGILNASIKDIIEGGIY